VRKAQEGGGHAHSAFRERAKWEKKETIKTYKKPGTAPRLLTPCDAGSKYDGIKKKRAKRDREGRHRLEERAKRKVLKVRSVKLLGRNELLRHKRGRGKRPVEERSRKKREEAILNDRFP